MKLGVFALATEYSMPVADLARAAEERSFDSLWVPEPVKMHSISRASRDPSKIG